MEQLRRWRPTSGWGKLSVVITYEQGIPKFAKRVMGEETVLLPGWSEQTKGSRGVASPSA